MKQFISILFLVFFTNSLCLANHKQWGAGVIFGDPTGLSGKYQLSPDNAIDAALAWSIASNTKLIMHSTYLFNRNKEITIEEIQLDWYFGLGARISLQERNSKNNEFYFGPRAPIGLKYFFHEQSIEVFSEIAIVFDIVPETSADIDFGLGARFYF